LQLIDFDYFGVTSPSFNFRAPGIGEDYTAEVRWNVTDRKFINWVVGAFYIKNNGGQGTDVFVPFTNPLPAIIPFSSTNYALFGEATATLGAFEMAAGLRHDWDENVDQRGVVAKEQKFLPRATLRYSVASDASIYAVFSTGYRSGGANTGLFPAGADTFGPEDVRNYEIGAKASLFGSKLFVAGAVYQMDFDNLQARNRIFPPGSAVFLEFTDNTGTARNRGFELEADWRATDRLSISGGIAYTDFTYTDFVNAGINFTGNKVQDSTDWTGVFRLSYDQPLTDNVTGYFRTDLSYTGKIVFDRANRLIQDPYTLANLRVGLRFRKLDLSVYAQNLFNEQYFIEFSPGGVRRPNSTGALVTVNGGTVGRPLTAGIAARFNF